MALINCPECGKQISDAAQVCPDCGFPVGKTKYCQHCGQKIPVENKFCNKCGRQVSEIHSSNITVNNRLIVGKEKNKWVALVLCVMLGMFGIHKFYEGKILTGILYLFTFGLLGFGWVIDIILIALKPNPYYV